MPRPIAEHEDEGGEGSGQPPRHRAALRAGLPQRATGTPWAHWYPGLGAGGGIAGRRRPPPVRARTIRAAGGRVDRDAGQPAHRAPAESARRASGLSDRRASGQCARRASGGAPARPSAPAAPAPRRPCPTPGLDVGIVITDTALLGRDDDAECAQVAGYGTVPAYIVFGTLLGKPPCQLRPVDEPQPDDEVSAVFRRMYTSPHTGEDHRDGAPIQGIGRRLGADAPLAVHHLPHPW